jgi:hypothetical protein
MAAIPRSLITLTGAVCLMVEFGKRECSTHPAMVAPA